MAGYLGEGGAVLILLQARIAHAGCGADPDAEAKAQSAPLVAIGTIESLSVELVEGDYRTGERLRFDTVLKG